MAFRHALDAVPGPVYLECATDIVGQSFIDEDKVNYPENYRADFVSFGDPELIEKAADMLISAKSPAMVIGNGSRYGTQYGESIAELANYLKIPVMAQTNVRGLFADENTNPLFRLGGAVLMADVVLLISATNDFRLNKLEPPLFRPDVKTIQVNPAITEIGFNKGADLGIVGSAGAVVKQILDTVKSKTAEQKDLTWINQAAEADQMFRMEWITGNTSDELPMNPGRCAAEVAKFLASEGKDWTVICDGGDSAQWMIQAVTASRPGQIVSYGPLGTIGLGAGFTIGAWCATGKPVLYFTGDGSFGFHAMEFDSFVRHGVPVVCVISNDSAWGMIKHSEEFFHKEEVKEGHIATELSYMRRYDKMPLMWDGFGELVTKPEDIIPAIKRGFESGRPSIINVEVDMVNCCPITKFFGAMFDAQNKRCY